MKREEFLYMLAGMRSAYPNAKIAETKEGMEMWFKMLEDLPYQAVSLALQAHISSNIFPPTIADLRKRATTPKKRDWAQGYELLRRAISLYGVYREAEALEWIENQDSFTAQIVRRLNFKELCVSEDVKADRANFRMAFQSGYEYEEATRAIPVGVQKALENFSDGLKMEALEEWTE